MSNMAIPAIGRRIRLAAALLILSTTTPGLQSAFADSVFTWVNGPQTTAEPGVYGGVPANVHPGARNDPATWTDSSGRIWLFGGYGLEAAASAGYLNDVWMFDPLTNNWSFEAGSQFIDQNGTHGTLGVPAASNNPGGRWGAVGWTGPDGRFWLFGGYGYDDFGTREILNDTMVFDPVSGLWTWIAGSNAAGAAGVPGSGPTASPSARYYPITWTDSAGNFWLYGGYGNAVSGFGNLNDLWTFNPITGHWSLIHGSNTVVSPSHGIKGVAAPSNTPGSRANTSTAWVGPDGNFYIFGGYLGGGSYANDLWKYEPSTNLWTWIGGTDLPSQPGVYGTLGIPASTNIPGGRGYSRVWNDHSGQIWLFGGWGRDSVGLGNSELGDLWKYNTATNEWSWEKGSPTGDSPGVPGVLGIPDPLNVPSARDGFGAWVAPDGTFWLFGGYGFEPGHYRSDLWTLNVSYTADVAAILSASSPGIILGQTVTYSGQITNNGPDHAQNVVATMNIGGEPLEFNPQLAPGVTASAVPGSVTFNIDSIAPGQTIAVGATVTPTLPGTVETSLGLAPAATDLDPSNNAATVLVQVVQGDGPDLTVGGSATQSCRVTRSGTRCRIRTTALVSNTGNQDALKSTMRVYLSDDAIWDNADFRLHEVGVRKLRIGRSNTKRMTYNLVTGMTASGKFIIVVVDDVRVIAEGNEFNNKLVFGPMP